ncbi:MAG: GntR family transcriptional regulator [Methylobacteriaceae bacterium]|jgi:DNA-binding GntR family transcriptional regulator|nr:GntR family transcriptional regulator [Methylobacteriaceae bacterium]
MGNSSPFDDPDGSPAYESAPSDSDFQKLISTSLVDLVTKRLRADIFAGKYLPGKKLVVRELSEDLGVSHTPIKDALNRLSAEGLVEAFPNRSMVIRKFTNNELIENMGVRLMCEIFYAPEIIRNAARDPELIEELEFLWNAMGQLIRDKNEAVNHEQWVEYETRFHRRYMMDSANGKLISVYRALDVNRFTYFAYLWNNSIPLRLKTYELNMTEHREIIEALKEGSVERFSRAVAWHVVRACEDYVVDDTAREKISQIKRLAKNYLPDE